MLDAIRNLYEGSSPAAYRFRYALLAFDSVTILFVISTSFIARNRAIEIIDFALGLVILTDFCLRAWIQAERGRFLVRLSTWADAAAIVSFLAPIAGGLLLEEAAGPTCETSNAQWDGEGDEAEYHLGRSSPAACQHHAQR